MISTPAASICGPPMPKMATSRRRLSAEARRAAYMSPEASPAESKSGIGGMWRRSVARAQRRRLGRAASLDGKVQLLLLVLELVKTKVNAALREKLLMCAVLAQPALVKDEDAIGVLNGAQAMGNHEGGASGKQAAQGFADLQFGFGVHARGGLIENREARIVGQGAGEVDELALADGKRGAALVDAGGGAIRKRTNEFAQANFLERALDRCVLDVLSAQADVGLNRSGEEKRILEHDAELAAQVL